MVTTTTGLATDFITFTRTSNATVTDSNGFIKWAGHNLLTHSESFDNAAWIASGTVIAAPTKVAANAVAAPNGTTTADEVSFPAVTGAGDVSILVQSFTNMPLVQHTAGIWVKAKAAGDIGKQIVLYSWTGVMAIKTHVTLDGTWQYVSASGTWTANNPNYAVGVIGSTYGGVNQGAVSVYLWGAHLYRSDLGGMVLNPARGDAYYPTTPRNLLGFTEDFSNAYWNKLNLLAFGSGSVSNAVVAPNGLQTADLIIPDTTSGTHVVYASVSSAGNSQTHSIYVKPNGYTKVALREDQATGASVAFLLSGAGSVLATNTLGGLTPTNPAITALSDGWYRISTTFAGSTPQRFALYILPDSYTSGAVTGSWTPNGTSGIYVWGAQASDSASLDAYSPVYDAAVTSAAYYAPRLDYSGSSLAALGLLVEEQRTNLLLQSNDLANASWTLANAGSRTASTDVAPDGTTSAATITDNISGNFTSVRQTLTVTNNSAAYAASVYIKKTTSASSYPGVSLALTGGTAKYASAALNTTTGVATARTGETPDFLVVSDAGSYWRLSFGITNNTTGNTSLQLDIYAAVNADASATWVAATTGSVVAWGAQLEAGSFATSYIPTGASTATRTADVASVSTQAFPYSASEGTLVASGLAFNFAAGSSTNCLAALSDGTTSNANYVYSFGDTPYSATTNGGNVQANITSGSALSPNTVFKLGYAIKANDFAFTSNGASVGTDTSGSVPTANQLQLGRVGSAVILNGHIRQITYIPRRLSNSELQARTV